jgi:hypothetical protein
VIRVEACEFIVVFPAITESVIQQKEQTAARDEDQQSDDLRQAELWTTTRSSVDVAISELTGSR